MCQHARLIHQQTLLLQHPTTQPSWPRYPVAPILLLWNTLGSTQHGDVPVSCGQKRTAAEQPGTNILFLCVVMQLPHKAVQAQQPPKHCTPTCWEKWWLSLVASTESCCTPLMLAGSSAIGSGAVSATVSRSSVLPSLLSKNSLSPAHAQTQPMVIAKAVGCHVGCRMPAAPGRGSLSLMMCSRLSQGASAMQPRSW